MNSQEKLEKGLAGALSPILDVSIDRISFNLSRARGYWTHNYQDVMQITGHVLVDGRLSYSIGSWESMTNLIRRGFRVVDERRSSRAYSNFTIETLDDC